MSAIEIAVRVIVDLLVRGEYATVERVTHGRHLSASEMAKAVDEYGRRLIAPGSTWWDDVTVTPVDEDGRAAFHIAAPLWTAEEGRSDLTLELELVELAPQLYESEVLNLHML